MERRENSLNGSSLIMGWMDYNEDKCPPALLVSSMTLNCGEGPFKRVL